MTQNIFSINPRIKDSAGEVNKKLNRGYAEPATAEQIDSMLGSEGLKQMVEAIRQGDEALKETLPYVCPHYSAFRNNHRAQADIIAEAFTHVTCVDVDDKELVAQAIERALKENENPFSDFEGEVVYIEYSARKKVHIWIRLPVGMTVAEAQQAFCKEIEIPYDESCTTPERFIYMTGDAVYRSEKWLQPLTEQEVAEHRKAYADRGLEPDGSTVTEKGHRVYAGAQNSDKMPAKTATEARADGQSAVSNPTSVVPATERTAYILKRIMEQEELKADIFSVEGRRHNAVKMILAHATQLLSQGEFLGALGQLWPGYAAEKDITDLVSDYYTKYLDKSHPLTVFQKKVFRESMKMDNSSTNKADQAETPASEPLWGDTAPLSDIYASTQPPRLPKKLPQMVKVATSQTPQEMKPTVAQGMFPALGVYPRNLSFMYTDNQYRELRINCLTVGGTGSGKDTSLKQPIKHITAPMAERDAVNRQRLKEYNEAYSAAKANAEKPKRPTDLIIQKVGSDLTPARLAQLMDDSQGAFLYTHLHEFEQWYGIEGLRGQQCTFKNLKLADDEDNSFGQERAGVQSVNYTGPLGLNWNASTTPNKLQNMFKNVMVDGPVSRVCLATTPDVGLAAPMPRYGRYDEKYDAALRPYIEHLQAATGEITCHQAIRLAERLKAECDKYTIKSQDDVFDNLSHRALVHAFRKACLLYAANGMKWEKAIEGFCRWSLHYDLWLKLHFFGDMIRTADKQVKTSKRGPNNLLEQIATDADGVFAFSDAVAVRVKNSKKEEGTGNMLSQWKSRGYIEALPNGKYRKLKAKD